MVLCDIVSELLADFCGSVHSHVAHNEDFFKIVIELVGDILVFAYCRVDSARHTLTGLLQSKIKLFKNSKCHNILRLSSVANVFDYIVNNVADFAVLVITLCKFIKAVNNRRMIPVKLSSDELCG